MQGEDKINNGGSKGLLSQRRLTAFAEVSRDIAQVVFASLVVGGLLTNLNAPVIVFGGIVSSVFWALSIFLADVSL